MCVHTWCVMGLHAFLMLLDVDNEYSEMSEGDRRGGGRWAGRGGRGQVDECIQRSVGRSDEGHKCFWLLQIVLQNEGLYVFYAIVISLAFACDVWWCDLRFLMWKVSSGMCVSFRPRSSNRAFAQGASVQAGGVRINAMYPKQRSNEQVCQLKQRVEHSSEHAWQIIVAALRLLATCKPSSSNRRSCWCCSAVHVPCCRDAHERTDVLQRDVSTLCLRIAKQFKRIAKLDDVFVLWPSTAESIVITRVNVNANKKMRIAMFGLQWGARNGGRN